MRPPSDYFALIESFSETTEALRAMPDAAQQAAGLELMEQAFEHFLRVTDTPEKLEKLCVWHADKLYRIMNAVDVLDTASFVFLRAVGSAFGVVLKQRKTSVAYLVDNEVPMDRLLGIRAAFKSLGFTVVSPELLIADLAQGTDDDLAALRTQAMLLARKQFRDAVSQQQHVLWLSGSATTEELTAMAHELDAAPYVGVFRNDVPADGTTVHVFRQGGRSVPLQFN
jgi:hypothetical protein